jgi:plastocyanin
MRCMANLASVMSVLLAALAPIAATGGRSHASAGQFPMSGTAAATVVTVEIRELKFQPATVTLHEGETVEWKNDDTVPHTATADGNGEKPIFDSGNIQTGSAWRHVARQKGMYSYSCTLHPNMHGKLIVD